MTEQERGVEELHPMTSETRIAVMSVQIGHIGDTLQRIEAQGAHAVPRTEWEQRNLYVDGRFSGLGTDIVQTRAHCVEELAIVKAEIASRRAPWWTVVATIGGVFATVVLLFEFVPRILN
jgi:hypothetical protein